MKLNEALLCVDCESLYSQSSHCPDCGSQVCFPLDRALNRCRTTASELDSNPLHEIAHRARHLSSRSVHPIALM